MPAKDYFFFCVVLRTFHSLCHLCLCSDTRCEGCLSLNRAASLQERMSPSHPVCHFIPGTFPVCTCNLSSCHVHKGILQKNVGHFRESKSKLQKACQSLHTSFIFHKPHSQDINRPQKARVRSYVCMCVRAFEYLCACRRKGTLMRSSIPFWTTMAATNSSAFPLPPTESTSVVFRSIFLIISSG